MLTFAEIQKATRATIDHKNFNQKPHRISINTRTLKKGDVFIAVKGKNFDAHRFINEAIKKGASAIVVSKNVRVSSDICVFKVKDTTQALGDIAGFYRRKFDIPVIAITGSAGKTTVKEMVARVLSSKYKVLKNPKTENNQFGVPLTLLRLKSSHDIAVIEIGTNAPGEIRALTQITYPTIGILTTIGAAHLEKLKTISGVFREKTDLIKYMDKSGTVIFNMDDKYLKKLKSRRLPQKKIAVSLKALSDYQARDCHVGNGHNFAFKVNNKSFSIPSLARHNITNAIIAILCGRLFGISYNTISNILRRFKTADGRFSVFKGSGIQVIDDSYNANPISVQSAVETLAMVPAKGKRIFVCADMKELGVKAKEFHKQIGQLSAQLHIDVVLGYGLLTKDLVRAAQTSDHTKSLYFKDRAELHKVLKKMCSKGDVILVKGSRSMHMEQTVQFLSDKILKVTH